MKNNVKKVVFSALFAAIVFVGTIISFPVPGNGGYVHLGDAFIYLACALLPVPYGICCAGLGACLADFSLGAGIWAPFTLIIKVLMALCFSSKKEKIVCPHNLAATALALIINVVGYYFAEYALFANLFAPVASIPFNITQSLASAVLFVIAGRIFDKFHFKGIFQLK